MTSCLMVFDDPHFPWEQEGSPLQDKIDEDNEKAAGKLPRNKVPRAALMTLSQSERLLWPL